MEERITPLIAERAPLPYADRPGTAYVRRALHTMLGYEKTLKIARNLEHADPAQIMLDMADRLR